MARKDITITLAAATKSVITVKGAVVDSQLEEGMVRDKSEAIITEVYNPQGLRLGDKSIQIDNGVTVGRIKRNLDRLGMRHYSDFGYAIHYEIKEEEKSGARRR